MTSRVLRPWPAPGHRRVRARLVALACAALAAGALVGCGSSSSGSGGGTGAAAATATGAAKPATINLWLAGQFSASTPGTAYRQWVNDQITRFKAAHPGSNVNVTLLPVDNDQAAAKLEAAFTSHQVPDVLLIFSGGYTTPYISSLTDLSPYINASPGMYSSIADWDLSCADLNCQNGKGQIYGVPLEFVSYGLFYNKAMFAKAGISGPPATWSDLLSDCSKLKSSGVIPIAYGDRDGYSSDNWVTLMYASHFSSAADVSGVNSGALKYTDPKLVTPLEKLVQLHTNGCVNADASTHENVDANNYFLSKKAAMVLMFPQIVTQFEKALGKDLGVASVPVSGNGPLAGTTAGNSNDNFVIPKGAPHPALGFDFVKLATDATAGSELLKLLGSPTLNKAAASHATKDPIVQFFLKHAQDPSMPLLDSVIPAKIALFYYKELQQAFAGTVTPPAAMQAVQQDASQANP
jgi:raffinose/stachyose/melibiose transport system substrate-binding protein